MIIIVSNIPAWIFNCRLLSTETFVLAGYVKELTFNWIMPLKLAFKNHLEHCMKDTLFAEWNIPISVLDRSYYWSMVFPVTILRYSLRHAKLHHIQMTLNKRKSILCFEYKIQCRTKWKMSSEGTTTFTVGHAHSSLSVVENIVIYSL